MSKGEGMRWEWLYLLSCVVDWHGCLILFLLACGWLVATYNKQREVKRLRNGLPCSYMNQKQPTIHANGDIGGEEREAPRPSVFIVVPTKGVKQHSLRNWRTFIQAAQAYKGTCEVLFCVESKDDPAVKAVQEQLLQDDCLTSCSGEIPVGVKVCERAKTCSQKLHNIISGIDYVSKQTASGTSSGTGRADWDYMLFLDDDIKIHQYLFDNLVDTLEQNIKAFMCTAYPFDVPELESGFVPYCVAAYHLRLIIAFSLGYTTTFVWGGCMLFRTEDLIQDAHNLVSSWRNGGYSDDLIASSVSQANKLTIMCNPSSILLQELPRDITFQQYWNYMSRQVFVLDTYTSGWHKILNHVLIGIHSYLSTFFILAVLINLSRYVYISLKVASLLINIPTLHSKLYQYSIRRAYTRVMQWMVRYISAIFFFLCLILAICALKKFLKAMDALFDELYSKSNNSSNTNRSHHTSGLPSKKSSSTSTASTLGQGLGFPRKHTSDKDELMRYSLKWTWFQHAKIWFAFCVDVALFVPAAIKALCSQQIEWSGIKYWKKDGLINKIVH